MLQLNEIGSINTLKNWFYGDKRSKIGELDRRHMFAHLRLVVERGDGQLPQILPLGIVIRLNKGEISDHLPVNP